MFHIHILYIFILRILFFTEQKEQLEKQQAYEKRELAKFRSYCEERVNRFIKDEKRKSLQFQPLNQFYRSIVYVTEEFILEIWIEIV